MATEPGNEDKKIPQAVLSLALEGAQDLGLGEVDRKKLLDLLKRAYLAGQRFHNGGTD